jgi:hypothetical protein
MPIPVLANFMLIEPFDFALANIPANEASTISQERVRQIAGVWDEEVSRILHRILAIGQEQRVYIPERGLAAYEMVKLAMFLTQRVVEKHLSERRLAHIDPDSESAALGSAARRMRIDATATMAAERIWIPLLDRWASRERRIVVPSSKPPLAGLRRRERRKDTRRNHYSPRFSNRLWAGDGGKVAVYTLSPGDKVEMKLRDPGQWGFERGLYSQGLERYLGTIESVAMEPLQKVLDVIPLSVSERAALITFLIAQWLRSPAFILTHLSGLRAIIHEQDIPYSTHVQSLKRAYESMFENDILYATLYRTIDTRSWRMLVAPEGHSFIRPDSVIVITGRANVYYPLAPHKCLHIGPDIAGEDPPVILLARELTADQVERVNSVLASFALQSAMATPEHDSAELRATMGKWFGTSQLIRQAQRSRAFQYWGALSRP